MLGKRLRGFRAYRGFLGLGFGIWGLGFGVRVLGFGLAGQGFRGLGAYGSFRVGVSVQGLRV